MFKIGDLVTLKSFEECSKLLEKNGKTHPLFFKALKDKFSSDFLDILKITEINEEITPKVLFFDDKIYGLYDFMVELKNPYVIDFM